MDQQIKFYNAALFKPNDGFVIPIFRGTSRYKYGAGFGDVRCRTWRFI